MTDGKDTGNGMVPEIAQTENKKTVGIKLNVMNGNQAVKDVEKNGTGKATEMGASSHGISAHHQTS